MSLMEGSIGCFLFFRILNSIEFHAMNTFDHGLQRAAVVVEVFELHADVLAVLYIESHHFVVVRVVEIKVQSCLGLRGRRWCGHSSAARRACLSCSLGGFVCMSSLLSHRL